MPGIEEDLLPGMVGIERGHYSRDRIVKQDRTYPDPHVRFETVGRCEERLELAHRFTLVVEHRPAGTHPARSYFRTALYDWSRLGLDLLLDLPAESIGVR